MISRASSTVGLLALLSLTVFALGQPATMTWPEAVAQLTGERTKAETCVALLKRHGNQAQVDGQLLAIGFGKAVLRIRLLRSPLKPAACRL
jgi:hypothetical protein